MKITICLKLSEKNYSPTAPKAQILLGYGDDQSFETPRIKNYSVTAPSDHILLGNDDYQSFETPRKNNHSVTAPSTHIFLDDDDAQSFERRRLLQIEHLLPLGSEGQ